MAKPKLVLALLIFFVVGLFAATASAQTSMQRRAAEQAAETEAETETGDAAQTPSAETQQAQGQQEPQTFPAEPEVIRDEGARIFEPYTVHKPGLRLDMGFGDGIDRVRFGVGVGYMYALGYEITVFDEIVAVLRAGFGPDFTLLVDNQGFNGVAAFMTGRLHAVGTGAGGLGIEVAGGTGLGRGTSEIGGVGFIPAVRLGVYYAGRYFEAGYFYQVVPTFRASWMPPHNIGLRLHIPVLRN